ncbi:MAG: ribonuclease E inhibitor RraB [Mesorhizobium sp.]|uniref:ribonuclease E inhibitor RraB n=1 Tax=Mesorhizobium sp. TaxID=1871066 RepID=UPI001AD29025|nr:ribonuclease E inhibitor RraB [Mesorhizobium sp.]MBN9220486.1 ribonuclease E inhibitor RraB [Mesorhizobium sp.]
MIKKIASLLFGLSSVWQPLGAEASQATSANSDRWMIFERVASDGKPLVVIARTGNADARRLLLNGRATVVTCRTDPANVNDRGMPGGTERLYAIEDKLNDEPAVLAAGAIHVASVTGQGQRRMFIVHRDPLDLSWLLRSDPIQGFSCDASDVQDRQALIQLITPSLLETQLNGDQSVIASLQKHGDDGRAPRKTDFWFYGQRESLESLFGDLEVHGFSVDHWLSGPTGVVLSRKMPVDLEAFQELTPVIVDAVEKSKVDYDGWETMVVSQTSTSTDGRKGH